VRTVTVRVPATSANLGPGFDAFGLALGLYDEVDARVTGAGLEIEVTGEGAGQLPLDETHLVVRAARAAFERLGRQPTGLALRCRNAIPQGRGLGSSAAAIVAGVTVARALDGNDTMDGEAALALCAELEGHPDNVAACLLGGLTLAWTDNKGVHAVALPVADLPCAVAIPPYEVSTAEVRRLLPAAVPHAVAAANAGRAALLVEALGRRPDLLLAATTDLLHQPYRAPAMPASAELMTVLRGRGIAAVISGAGPTVLALGADADVLSAPAGWRLTALPVDRSGAMWWE